MKLIVCKECNSITGCINEALFKGDRERQFCTLCIRCQSPDCTIMSNPKEKLHDTCRNCLVKTSNRFPVTSAFSLSKGK